MRDSATNSKGLGGNGVGIPWHSAEELTHLLLTSKLRRWIKNTWKNGENHPEKQSIQQVLHHFTGLKKTKIWSSGWWFQPTPLKNMTSSVGMVIPKIWKIKNVWNHQPGNIIHHVTSNNLWALCTLRILKGTPSLKSQWHRFDHSFGQKISSTWMFPKSWGYPQINQVVRLIWYWNNQWWLRDPPWLKNPPLGCNMMQEIWNPFGYLPRFIVAAELVIIELPTNKQTNCNFCLLKYVVYDMIWYVCSLWKIVFCTLRLCDVVLSGSPLKKSVLNGNPRHCQRVLVVFGFRLVHFCRVKVSHGGCVSTLQGEAP